MANLRQFACQDRQPLTSPVPPGVSVLLVSKNLRFGVLGTAVRPGAYASACTPTCQGPTTVPLDLKGEATWQDSLGRDFDFYLEHFPEELGPREIILPHNPMFTREMNIQAGEVLLGRPLGMSCGCPITHCGVAMSVEHRTGVINWCVTGPLRARQEGYRDIGCYIAEGYEGLIRECRVDVRIGMRY